MIGVCRFLRSRFLKRLIQRDAGNEPRPQEAANVQFSHRLVMAEAGLRARYKMSSTLCLSASPVFRTPPLKQGGVFHFARTAFYRTDSQRSATTGSTRTARRAGR